MTDLITRLSAHATLEEALPCTCSVTDMLRRDGNHSPRCAKKYQLLRIAIEQLRAADQARIAELLMEMQSIEYEHGRLWEEKETAEARIAELEALVQTLIDNDPDDMAADGVTVLDVWRKDARKALACKTCGGRRVVGPAMDLMLRPAVEQARYETEVRSKQRPCPTCGGSDE